MKNNLKSLFETVRKAFFLFYKKITYSNLSDKHFKMDRYIDLVVNDNISKLKKYPVYIPKTVLFAIYGTLQSQYIEMSGDSKIKAKIKRKQQLDVLKRKYNILITCGTVLTVQPKNKDVIEFLERSGIKSDNLLKRIETELKALQSKINAAIEFEKNDKDKEKKSEPLSEAYYSRIFALLNKNGYKADRNMSVLDFIETMALYRKEIEENNKQVEKLKNRK